MKIRELTSRVAMIKSHCLGKNRYSLIIMPRAWGRVLEVWRMLVAVVNTRVNMVTCL